MPVVYNYCPIKIN